MSAPLQLVPLRANGSEIDPTFALRSGTAFILICRAPDQYTIEDVLAEIVKLLREKIVETRDQRAGRDRDDKQPPRTTGPASPKPQGPRPIDYSMTLADVLDQLAAARQ